MRKSWLIAGAVAATAGAAQAGEVQLFGVHTPSLGKWAVYARISDVNSTAGDGLEVVGLSSISINVLNNTTAGVGTSAVTSSAVTLPFGVSKYVDTVRWPEAPEGVGYGFWVKDLRRNGTLTAGDGAREISATQFAIYPKPVTTIPYQRLVLTGIGLTPGSAVKNDTTGGDFKTAAGSWGYPIQVASGNYTPAATTGAGANLGLKIQYSDPSGAVNLLRPLGNDFEIEAPTKQSVVNARSYVVSGAAAALGDFTVKAGQGDSNLDGVVNFDDLLTLARNYGTTGKTWFEGDFDYSGGVNFNDLLALARNYGSPVPGDVPQFGAAFNADVASAFAAVPEPGTIALLGIGAAGLAGRRRRK